MTAPNSLPAHPSLESLRKQAKKLGRDVAAGDAAATAPCTGTPAGCQPPPVAAQRPTRARAGVRLHRQAGPYCPNPQTFRNPAPSSAELLA